MDKVTPIRDDVLPTFDKSREIVQYVAEQINQYFEEYGEHPYSIAFVLGGQNHRGAMTTAHSWTPNDEDSSRLQCCAVASAVLLKRALDV